jgi:SAM-dependent MidA family methyltransferase
MTQTRVRQTTDLPMMDVLDQAVARRAAVEALARREIDAAGARLPFDRFMELVLYAPGLGYYVAGAEKLGPEGDFVTAPEISPLFGRCLAVSCREVLTALDQDQGIQGDLLELGAGSGALAADLLTALANDGPLPGRYLILEPSPDLAERQRQTLRARVPDLLERCHWLERLPGHFDGLVLANEVLDAMPVHRFQISDQGGVQEVCVSWDGDQFVEVLVEPAATPLEAAVKALQTAGLATDPGYRSEVNLRLAPWTQALAGMLGSGLLLLIDYGYPRTELYLAERRQGTLMCHSRHRAHDDPYRDLGLQDITAHVDFSALAEAGQAAGLRLAGYTTQANFLIGCGIDALIAEAGADDPAALLSLTAGAKQLLLPSLMGERFQVMALSRDLDNLELSGFSVRDLRARL